MLKQSKASLGGRLRPPASVPLGALVTALVFALASPWLSGSVQAAGLGRLTVVSVQGQPFKAEIDLVAVKKEEKAILTARLASQEAFRQASVDYLPVLSTFYASIETRANGSPYVRIVSRSEERRVGKECEYRLS